MSSIDELLAVMARLRDPATGCPWDVEQTFETIAPYTIEEAHEVADAVARGAMDELVDELGDLLFQVVFHARMAEEGGHFDFAAVVAAIVTKMVRRHPHVFADAAVSDAREQSIAWERIKAEERAGKRAGNAASLLDRVGGGLPALARAAALQRTVARCGFDWDDAGGVLDKLDEEAREMREAISTEQGGDPAAELGDLLFTCVNLARHLGMDADMALRSSCERFERRFRGVEADLSTRGERVDTADRDRLDAAWERVKAAEPDAGGAGPELRTTVPPVGRDPLAQG